MNLVLESRLKGPGRCMRPPGFSLVELLITVSVLGILAALGIAFVNHGAISGTKLVKIEQDQRTLNTAVTSFLASGGDLSGVKDPNEVLARLKTTAPAEQRDRLPGFSGSFLDPTAAIRMQSPSDAERGEPRLVWDPERQRFDLARSGPPGIAGLVNADGDDSGLTPPETMERETLVQYSAEGAWIWDYVDGALPESIGPSVVPTQNPESTTPEPTSSVPPTPVNREALFPPVFSIPGGNYERHEFDLDLSLENPNPPQSSRIYYSSNYGDWLPYSGAPLAVAPETHVRAQSIPLDSSAWDPSPVAEENYRSSRSILRPPAIDFDHPYFESSKSKSITSITVSLDDPNTPGLSTLRYRIVPLPGKDGPSTAFAPYSGPFVVSASTYPEGFGIRAYASAAQPGYEDSRIAARYATSKTDLFGGHLDLDTSTFIAEIGRGSTDAHTHDILSRIGGTAIDFFAIPESRQVEIHEAVPDPAQRFKLLVVNGALSPGMNLVLEYESGGYSEVLDVAANRYDDTSIEDLTVFSLGGVPGSARLTGLRVDVNQDLIYEAGMIPTNTRDVRSNVLGKGGEWRNGSFTIQAVAVNPDGTSAYTVDPGLSNGGHGAARSGLLWEAALFWHWSGDSYHQERNTYKPGDFNSIRLHVGK